VKDVLRQPRVLSLAACLTCLAFAGPASGDTFTLDVSSDDFTIYTDPNTGNELKLAGLSGLASVPGAGDMVWAVTDRGPKVDAPDADSFVIPDYAPRILLIQLRNGGVARIVREIRLRKPDGSVTGLPSPCLDEGVPVDLNGEPIALDPDGLDPEGITLGSLGTFWICEEYLPSIAFVLASGRVAMRLVPAGTLCSGQQIPTFDVLPGPLAKRRPNRGFEGIARAPDGIVYAIMQRPLSNPTTSVGDNSRNIRIVALDPGKALMGLPGGIRQLLYLNEPVPAVIPPPHRLRDTYASDMEAISQDILLVTERATDKLFAINVRHATDITPFEDASGALVSDPARTIEMLSPTELAAMGIQPVSKVEVLSSLKAIDPVLAKVEGLTVSHGQLIICQDSDFNLQEEADFSTVPATLLFQDPPNPSKIFTLPLPALPH
jgi:hypothetical protein